MSLIIDKPGIVGFVGPNGAGKSTMMKILTTYLDATNGSAIINGFVWIRNDNIINILTNLCATCD